MKKLLLGFSILAIAVLAVVATVHSQPAKADDNYAQQLSTLTARADNDEATIARLKTEIDNLKPSVTNTVTNPAYDDSAVKTELAKHDAALQVLRYTTRSLEFAPSQSTPALLQLQQNWQGDIPSLGVFAGGQ